MINWGIIGTGQIAFKFKEALSVVNEAKLNAVASRSLEKAKLFLKDNPEIKAYGSYEDLVNDPTIDIIYIATPHVFHKDNALLCLQANKSVLCEKPFTLNANDAKEVYEVAKSKKLFVMEAMWTKFLPAIQKAKEWVNQGEIGEIKMIRADFGFQSSFDPTNRIFNKALGGGGLLDVGIYPLTFSTLFLGLKPTNIVSDAYIGPTGIDEQAAMILKYKEGQLAILSCAVSTDTAKDAIIIGSKGKIVIPYFWMSDKAYLYVGNELEEEFQAPFLKNGYEYEIMNVNKCLKNHQLESDVNPMDMTIKILEMMDGMRRKWNLTYPTETTLSEI